MARPTIDHLLDIEIRIWRPTPIDDTIGVEERPLSPVGIVAARINRPSLGDGNLGAGLTPIGSVRWYGRPDIDVNNRDVCEVISGPEAGRTFEVNGPPVHPENHHTQVDCIEWSGELPELDS